MNPTTNVRPPDATCPSPGPAFSQLGIGIAIAFGCSFSAPFVQAQPSPSATPGVARSVSQLDVGQADELSLARERLIGDSIAKYLYQDPDYIDEPIIDDVVQVIWGDLLRSARQQQLLSPDMEQAFAWHIFLGRDKSFNAFALPGGFLGLHLGLIATSSTPDELASVLAHELSHVIQRHISRGQAQSNRTSPLLLAAMLLGAAVAKKSDAVAQAAVIGGSALGTQLQLNYSRDMEREADRLGYAILKGAGYSPQGFVSMFEKLQSTNRWADDGNFPYLRTHPLNTERVAAMHNRLQQETKANPASPSISPLAYTLISAQARAHSALPLEALQQWASEAELPQPSQTPIEKRVHALVVGSHYFEKTGQSGKATRLLVQLQNLVQADPLASAIAQRVQANLALVQGNWEAAAAFVVATPKTRADTLLKARAQIGLGQLTQAVELLQLWVAQHGHDASAWQLLAQAYERQGQLLRQVRALAEAQLAQYDPQGALDRLKAAQALATQKSNNADADMELSIINSRSNTIQARGNLVAP